MSGKHIVITVNAAWNLWNYRTGIIRMLLAEGHRVTLLAPRDETVPKLTALGCDFMPIEMSRRGRAPHTEALVLAGLARSLRRLRPDAVLSFTIKNNIYAGIACRFLGIPFLPNVSGRGAVFSQSPLLVRMVVMAYRLAFGRAATVFYQNPEDRAFFLARGIGRAEQAALLPGSGVDLTAFAAVPLPGADDAPVFLMVARLLKDKGVAEYARAAARVQAQFPRARFRILGAHEDGPDYISAADLRAWQGSGWLEHPGTVPDIRPEIAAADAVVLPSYYLEGTPRALIEAAAMGRPIVTTDTPGCRDTVIDGQSGYLVAPRDAEDLGDKLLRLCEMTAQDRDAMGRASRRLAEQRFDEAIVLRLYRTALADRGI
ncbi:glycosyltransferase family 4 protein [Rhodophyticola sp.]|uniref:glycosyltransferase family 4 protein n=1 Tax=Rhodophyticola sp. TaxID=2680032 RepID=UPI003D29130F